MSAFPSARSGASEMRSGPIRYTVPRAASTTPTNIMPDAGSRPVSTEPSTVKIGTVVTRMVALMAEVGCNAEHAKHSQAPEITGVPNPSLACSRVDQEQDRGRAQNSDANESTRGEARENKTACNGK